MEKARTIAIVSRKWNNPKITVAVVTDHKTGGISISMDMDKFLKALADEMGNPTMLLTKGMLEKKINEASTLVIREMKEASTKAV